MLDAGCGPGTDLAALAAATGPTGAVFGIDQDPEMVATARTRMADKPTVRVSQADAHHLPLKDCSIDRAVTAGYLTPDAAHAWLELLTAGTFFATTSFNTVLAQSSR